MLLSLLSVSLVSSACWPITLSIIEKIVSSSVSKVSAQLIELLEKPSRGDAMRRHAADSSKHFVAVVRHSMNRGCVRSVRSAMN